MTILKPRIKDPYTQSTFGLFHRLRRLGWNIVWVCLFRPSPVFLYSWRRLLLRLHGAKIGAQTYIYPRAKIWAPWLLTAEDVATIANDAEIYNPGEVVLRHHCIVSQSAFLCGATHDYNSPDFPMTWKKIELGAYAWVCARAVVLPGVKIGEGAVLGAAAVTSHDLEPWAVYAGNPARKVAMRKRQERLATGQ